VRLARNVYRIAGAPVTEAQRAYAAVLVAGPDTVVCGLSALALLGITDAPTIPMLCAPPTGSGRTPGALVRRSPLNAADRTHVGPIPITTPARALLEAAPLVPDEVLEALVDDVVCEGLASPSAILGAIRRAATGRGRRGSPRVRAAVQPWISGVRPGSPGEVRLLRRLTTWGLPAPVRQHPVRLADGSDVLIDLAWPERLVGLEYDGARWHTPRRLAADERREAGLRALGWRILRADKRDLQPSSTRLRDELEPLLRLVAA
jgi:hypothetical protein